MSQFYLPFKDDCQNYIRVLVKMENTDNIKDEENFFDMQLNRKNKSWNRKTSEQYLPSRLFVCGTNAYNPRCRYYKQHNPESGNSTRENEHGTMVLEKEVSGKGFCPYDPKHNSTFIFAG